LHPDVGEEVALTGIQADATRVDHGELASTPLGGPVQPISRGARLIMNDGAMLADEPVEQRRLTDVWSANEGDDRHG
jgi:hypothetical protein